MSLDVMALVWRADMPPRDKRKMRAFVMDKSGGRCWYCGTTVVLAPHHAPNCMCVDHVVPQVGGGSGDLSNLVPTCRSCNASKGGKSVEEYRAFVLRRREGWPYFSAEQIDWLRGQGFAFPDVPPVVFWFERGAP